MRDENYWKTDKCRKKVAKKIFQSLLLLRPFEGIPARESIKFENYLFKSACSKEEYFSGFVRLVLQIRDELHRQGVDVAFEKPDRIDALRELDLPQGVQIPLIFGQGCVKSTLPSTPYNTPSTPAISQAERFLNVFTEENTSDSILHRDLYISPESRNKGDDFTRESDDDDGNFDDALANLSQNLFLAIGEEIDNSDDHVPKSPSKLQDVLYNNDDQLDGGCSSQAISKQSSYAIVPQNAIESQRIWVKLDLYSPHRASTSRCGIGSCTPHEHITERETFASLNDGQFFSESESSASRINHLQPQITNKPSSRDVSGTTEQQEKQPLINQLPVIDHRIEKAGPSVPQNEVIDEELQRVTYNKVSCAAKDPVTRVESPTSEPDEHIPSLQPPKSMKKKNRMPRGRKAYTSAQLKKLYLQRKLQIAKFELKSLKILHKLECDIRKKQMEKIPLI